MSATSRPDDLVERLERYFADRPDLGVVSVYLFGSHARGRPHRESDVDLGVLTDRRRHPTRRERFELRLRLVGELSGRLGREADVVMLRAADLAPFLDRMRRIKLEALAR